MSQSASQTVNSGSNQLLEVSAREAAYLAGHGGVIVDVRDEQAFRHRHIKGAIHIPLEELREIAQDCTSLADHDKAVILYCQDGKKSALGAELLNDLGFTHACFLKGGLPHWELEALPFTSPE